MASIHLKIPSKQYIDFIRWLNTQAFTITDFDMDFNPRDLVMKVRLGADPRNLVLTKLVWGGR